MTLESRVGAPQFFTLSSLLEQAKLAAQHTLRFYESTHWVAGVIRLTPGQHDTQTAHERDELYLVLRGEAVFRISADRHPVAPGDFWFVPAGVEHRFEEFHHELVVFYVLVEP